MCDRLKLQSTLASQRRQKSNEAKAKAVVKKKEIAESTNEILMKSVSLFSNEDDRLDDINDMETDNNLEGYSYKNETNPMSSVMHGPLSSSQRLMGVDSICENRSSAVEEAKRLSWEDSAASVSSKADWRRLLENNRMPIVSAAAMDTDALIRCIALRWIRWGLHVIKVGADHRGANRGNQGERVLAKGLFRGAKKALLKAVRREGVDVFHIHELAAFVSFGAALVHRILMISTSANNDVENSDQHLLRVAAMGKLPFGELSRESVRSFITALIGVDLKNPWEKFDAVWQRLCNGNKGFISASRVLDSFQLLCPTLNIIRHDLHLTNRRKNTTSKDNVKQSSTEHEPDQQALVDAECFTLFLMSIAAWTISSDAATSAHLSLLILMHKNIGNAKFAAALNELSNPTVGKNSDHYVIEESNQQKLQHKLEEKLLVADLLYELTKGTVRKLKVILGDSAVANLSNLSASNRGRTHPDLKLELSLLIEVLKDSPQSFGRSKLELFCHHHETICVDVAKALSIYDPADGSGDSELSNNHISTVLLSFSNCLVAFNFFRLALLSQSSTLEVSLAPSQRASSMESVEAQLSAMLSPDSSKAAALFDRAAVTPLASLESVQAEMLGIPVPAILTGITKSTYTNAIPRKDSFHWDDPEDLLPLVETSLCLKQLTSIEPLLQGLFLCPLAVAAIEEGDTVSAGKVKADDSKGLAPAIHLAEIRQTVMTRDVPSLRGPSLDLDPPSDQLTQQYLQTLTSKLSRLNRILRDSVALWRWVQLLPQLTEARRTSILPDLVSQDSNRQGPEDVPKEAKHLQRLLLEENEWRNEPRFLQIQSQMREMSGNRSSNNAALQDIALMEDGLKQASSDAFKMLSRIMRSL